MKRVINWLVPLLFAIVTVGFAGFLLWDAFRNQNTAPRLVCDSDTLYVGIHDGDEVLLAGVTAVDDEDGDITDQITIEKVSNFTEPGVSHITYAVQDSHNAVTKLTRTLCYTDYTSPRFSLKAPLTFVFGKSINPIENITATDCIDGDLSDKVRMSLLEDDSTISGVGKWKVRFRVTNSMGDTVYLTTDVTVTNANSTEEYYTPEIRLSDYLVYVPVGGTFDPRAYVSGISVRADIAEDNPLYLAGRLRVNSDVDTSRPGVYTVEYTCASSRQYVGTTSLIVVVGDLSE